MVLPKCKDLQEAAPVGRNQVALVIFAQNDREGVHVSVKRYRETLQEGGDWRVFECSSRRKGEGGVGGLRNAASVVGNSPQWESLRHQSWMHPSSVGNS